MAEVENLVSDRSWERRSTHAVCIACFQIVGIIRIWPLVIGLADIDELLADT
jgi:hypothetical protein